MAQFLSCPIGGGVSSIGKCVCSINIEVTTSQYFCTRVRHGGLRGCYIQARHRSCFFNNAHSRQRGSGEGPGEVLFGRAFNPPISHSMVRHVLPAGLGAADVASGGGKMLLNLVTGSSDFPDMSVVDRKSPVYTTKLGVWGWEGWAINCGGGTNITYFRAPLSNLLLQKIICWPGPGS